MHRLTHKTIPIIFRVAFDDRLCSWYIIEGKSTSLQVFLHNDMFFAPVLNGWHTINPERLSISLVSRLISFFDNDVNPRSNHRQKVKVVTMVTTFNVITVHPEGFTCNIWKNSRGIPCRQLWIGCMQGSSHTIAVFHCTAPISP